MTTHQNKIIICDFPMLEYGQETGRLINCLIKLIFQRAWLRRNLEDSPTPVLLWQDEFQYFVTRQDNFFQQTCRGSRVAVVCLTQNILNLSEELGEAQPGSKTKSFLGNLATKVFHQQNDTETCTYAADQLGRQYTYLDNFSGGGSSGSEHTHFISGGSRQLAHILEPVEFTRLQKPDANSPLSQAIVYQSGKTFNATITERKPERQQFPIGVLLARLGGTMFGSSEEMHVEHLQNNALNIVEAACSVLAQPLEIMLRPWYGTRFYAVPVTAATAAMMLLLPALAAFFNGIGHMIPFMSAPAPRGMFDIGSLSKLYFLLMAVHGWRLWKRMLHMEREQHSEYEGPALPFFQLLPKSDSFWFTRIVWEPALLLLLSILLEDLFIIQSSLSLYLRFAALALAIKSFINWFRAWEYLRKMLDMRNAAPAIAKLVENQATEEDLAPIHLASFPKNIDPAVRQAAVTQIARAYSPER